MGQIKNIIKKQVASSNQQKYFSTSGVIIDYDRLYNTATIKFTDPNGDGTLYRRNVPVSAGLGGLSNNGISIGQECTLSFVNGNLYSPIIIGITTSTYTSRTMSEQGAYLIDEEIRQTSSPENISPMYQDWIDDDNTSPYTYDNEICQYKDKDIRQESFDTITNLNHYSDTEVGITHLTTHSGIKLKDNGDIDIFVEDNVGIRISKATHKIYLYGFDFSLNGEIDLLEIVNMLKNFKCNYEPVECKCDMDKLLEILNNLNTELQYIKQNMGNVQPSIPEPSPEPPHEHTILEITIQVSYENDGRLHPTTQTEIAHVTVNGGDTDDGCPVEKTLQCTNAQSISKTGENTFDVVFNEPGFYVLIATSKDEERNSVVGTTTLDVRGSDGSRSGSGQFVGRVFDSGWIDTAMLNGLYISSYHYDMTVFAGHTCPYDRIGVLGKKTNGDEVIISDLFNDTVSMAPYNTTNQLIMGDLWHDKKWEKDETLSLSDDIRQIRFYAETGNGHEVCVPTAKINFNVEFKFDTSLWVK